MKYLLQVIVAILPILLTYSALSQVKSNGNELNEFSEVKENQFYIGAKRDVYVTRGTFYDNGGENNDLTNKYAITTFHAKNNWLEIYFTEYNIPEGAEIRIYKGNTIEDELFGVFGSSDKIWNVKAQDITIEYIPSQNKNVTSSGWKGVINTITIELKAIKALMPESDCSFAIPLCQNSTVVVLGGQYTDLGSVNDDAGGCYAGTGSGGSVWYSFSPQATGPIDFSISPTGTTDYDFVVWDITNGCGSGQRQEKSCNYSVYTGATGLSTTTCNDGQGGGGNCTTNDCSTDSKQSDCNRWNRRLTATAGRQYAICVNFYSGANDGFVFSFKNEATSVGITDVTPPVIINAYANACGGATSLHLDFNEWVQCSTIQDADFTLAGYTFMVTNNYCMSGRTNHVDISVSPALPIGTYIIHAQDILDLCNNNMNSNYNVVLGSLPVANAGPDKVTCKSPGFFGIGWNYSPTSQTLTASGGTTYQWSDGQWGASVNVSPTATTTYTVTVANGACTSTDNVVVVVDYPIASAGVNQTICNGVSATLTATGGASYAWSNGGNTAVTSVTPVVTTTYTVTVTSAYGCTASSSVKVTVNPIDANAGADQTACAQGTAINLSGISVSGNSFSWNVGSPSGTQISTTQNMTVNPLVSTTYYFTSTNTTTGCSVSDAMFVSLANYGAITSFNGGGCNPSSLTFTNSPAVSGATSYTFTWYQLAGNAGCPTSSVGMTQLMQETILTTYDTTLVPLQTFDALVTSSIGAGLGGWNEVIQTNSVNNWAVGATSPIAVKSLCVKNATTYNAYTNTDDCEKIAYYGTVINASSGDNIRISFSWKCVGQSDPGAFGCFFGSVAVNTDHGHLVYALNNPTNPASWVEIGGPYWNQSATQNVVDLVLPAILNGQSFYIGFKWYNDGVAGCSSSNPFMIDNVSLKSTWHKIPTSTYTPAPLTPPAVNTYACLVTPIGGTCNNISSMAANCYILTCPNPLPIELVEFKASCKNWNILFSWSTASESNNDYFNIEGSTDALNYRKLATINGSGNSTAVNNYEYLLNNSSFKYFRLKQTDFDGKYSYSDIITTLCKDKADYTVTMFPNPASNNLTLNFGKEINSQLQISIKDLLGREIKEIAYEANEISFIKITLENLNKGIYFIQIEDISSGIVLPLQKFVKE
jgi:hypothetical protein